MSNVCHDHKRETTEGLVEHSRRVKFLDTLAILSGCRESLGGWLPDGLCPDVLRLNSRRNILFVGEAKNTEIPNSLVTQERLLKYLSWLSVHVTNKGAGIFAICFGRESDINDWVNTVFILGRNANLYFNKYDVELFEPSLIVSRFISIGNKK